MELFITLWIIFMIVDIFRYLGNHKNLADRYNFFKWLYLASIGNVLWAFVTILVYKIALWVLS